MRTPVLTAALVAFATTSGAQSLAKQITTQDGSVEVVFPARQGVCGDGEYYFRNAFGNGNEYMTMDGRNTSSRVLEHPCVEGPERVVATVDGGEVTRVRVFVGPIPPSRADMRRIEASAEDASAWLISLVRTGAPRPAADAVMPLSIANVRDPWTPLLAVVRDDSRPRTVRQAALLWTGNGVAAHLGVAEDRRETPDDEMRAQAVFALTQRPRAESVPELIDIARTSTHASARRAAIFWLGQTGDPRAADVYEELLKSK